ncbi:hypothetical protein MMC12_002494 [Toensbergia leucococca]|nr:hypothetical protein [Toensbergia leucococca]
MLPSGITAFGKTCLANIIIQAVIALIRLEIAQSVERRHATIVERKDTSAVNATLPKRKSPVTAAAKLAIFHATVPILVPVEPDVVQVITPAEVVKNVTNAAKSVTLLATVLKLALEIMEVAAEAAFRVKEATVVAMVQVEVEDVKDRPATRAEAMGICLATAPRVKNATIAEKSVT